MANGLIARFPSFESARVLVAGDVMLDRYWRGGASRISPEAPVPVVLVGEQEERPGGAANVGLNIAALGGRVRVLGITGDDPAADSLSEQLDSAGAQSHFVRLPDIPTITKLRVISRHQQLIRLDFEEGLPELGGAALFDLYRAHLKQTDIVVLSDYGKGALCRPQAMIKAARAAGRPLLVDPKGADYSGYRGATLITPNRAEFEAVAGPCPDDASLVDKGAAMLQSLSLQALLITRGEEGMTLLQDGRDPLHFPARAKEVYDVTGAGDTVIAVLAAALAAEATLADATALANNAAGIAVGKLGAAAVSAPELRRSISARQKLGDGVVSEQRLMELVAAARAHGETIALTNGCFDILHAGHVDYLEQSRQWGDRLVVAVNDDASVARLKGAGRPVRSLEQRMRVLAGLGAVDWVAPFSEDTPERLICRIKPEYLIKGGDYEPEQIAGGRCVREAGGQVIVVDFIESDSTSDIIARIQSRPRAGES